MPRSNIPLDGYPGDGAAAIRIDWLGDHFGPGPGAGNYQQPGEILTATSIACSGIESAGVSSASYSGNYTAKLIYPNNSANTENRAPTFSQVTIQWFYAANNTQVANNTDLSAEAVRLTARGI